MFCWDSWCSAPMAGSGQSGMTCMGWVCSRSGYGPEAGGRRDGCAAAENGWLKVECGGFWSTSALTSGLCWSTVG